MKTKVLRRWRQNYTIILWRVSSVVTIFYTCVAFLQHMRFCLYKQPLIIALLYTLKRAAPKSGKASEKFKRLRAKKWKNKCNFYAVGGAKIIQCKTFMCQVQNFYIEIFYTSVYNIALSGGITMKYKKWTQEDYELIKCMSEAGFTAKEIASELDCSENTVKHKKVLLGISTRQNSYKDKNTGVGVGGRPNAYTKEQLIGIMRAAPIHTYDYFNSKDSGLPAATTYRKYFGSWQAALEAAGITPNISSLKQNKPTTLYIVEFDGFYKLGITQQTVHQRLGGRYPPYTIVFTKIFDSLKMAKVAETALLDAVSKYKYVPENFPAEGRGFTECFKMTKSEFEEFFQKML